MATPNPTARAIFNGCSQATDAAIAGGLHQDRTRQGLHHAVTRINDYADDSIAAYQADFARQQGGTLACQAGCAFCCFGPVHLSPIELLNIVLYLDSPAVGGAQRALVQTHVERHDTRVAAMSLTERIHTAIACPFLEECQCGIYAVRPLFCRGRNSVTQAPCQAGMQDPGQPVSLEMLSEQTLVGQCLELGILQALQKIALPFHCLDLSRAMALAFATPDLVERWLGGENALQSVEVRS
jgi:Fe-S-cluster containining protein